MRIGRLGLLMSAILIASACGGTVPKPAGSATFTIDHPAQGAVVAISPVEVGGSASAGSRVVQDISLGADKDVIAGTDGRWLMLVELKEGANALVFRLGDDGSTEIHLGLTYSPGSGSASPAATPVGLTGGQTTSPGSSTAPTSPPVTSEPTEEPTPTEAPTPKPPTFRTFSDGTWEVGVDIKPGTYRLREPAYFCYWARLKGFDGTLDEILANENLDDAYGVVTIKATDAGFESDGCDEWSSDLSRVTDSKSKIEYDGTYILGTDFSAGRWKSSGGDSCYWARLSGFTGTLAAIIANGLPSGPTILTIRSTDKGFTTSGCGTWTRQ